MTQRYGTERRAARMTNAHLIDDSVDVLLRKANTIIRDRLLVLLCVEFEHRRVTQRELARLVGISQPYLSRLVTQAKVRMESEADAEAAQEQAAEATARAR